jgi:DNA-binding response OmpR family regulator
MDSHDATADRPEPQEPAPVRALVVDDEPRLVQLVTRYLEREGFQVQSAGDGEQAVELASTFEPEVIVLDLMLPRMDGIEACRRIRTFSDAYVVMVTARTEEVDKLVGLGVGADDYMTKPFSPRELVARIQAMLRRPRAPTPVAAPVRPVRRIGELVIDPAAREVQLAGKPVELTRLEFDLLEALSERPRVVLSRRQLLERVWGGDWYGDDHLVDVHIANLRHKLGDDPRQPRHILTVRGVGYRMGGVR